MKASLNRFLAILLAFLISGLGALDFILPNSSVSKIFISIIFIIPIAFITLTINRPMLSQKQVIYIWLVVTQAVVLFALINSSSSELGIRKVLLFVSLSVFPSVALILIINRSLLPLQSFILFLCIFSFIPIIRMFSLGISLHDWQTGVGAWQMRTSNLDVIGYSRLVGIGIIILIYKILQQKKNLFLIPVVIAMGVCQFLLRERGPIYFTLLSSVLIILFMVKSRFRLLVISLSVLAAFFLVNSYVSIDQRFDPRLILSDSRTLIIERSISLIMENPIFGVGTGSFSLSGNNPTQREYSHNIFLELMTENGVFGLGIFIITIIIVITSVRDVSKKLVSNSDSKLLFILFTYSFLQAQVSGDLSNNYFVWIFGSTIIGYEGFLKTHLPMKRGISINGK